MNAISKKILKKYCKKRYEHDMIKLKETLKKWLLISKEIHDIENKYDCAVEYHSKMLKYKCIVAWNHNHKKIQLFKKVHSRRSLLLINLQTIGFCSFDGKIQSILYETFCKIVY